MLTIIWDVEGKRLEELHSLVSHRIYTNKPSLLWWLCSSCRAYVEDNEIYTHRRGRVVRLGRIASVAVIAN